jgi:O-acetyl-ADP-ribose deacetylase (regulator of RNase III)
VALPSISTGIYAYPVEAAATIALGAVDAWIAGHPDALDVVTFVLFSADTLEAFERAIAG